MRLAKIQVNAHIGTPLHWLYLAMQPVQVTHLSGVPLLLCEGFITLKNECIYSGLRYGQRRISASVKNLNSFFHFRKWLIKKAQQ